MIPQTSKPLRRKVRPARNKIEMVDLRDIDTVQIEISPDGKKIWVNSNEGVLLRIQGIKTLEVSGLGNTPSYYRSGKG